MLKLFLFMVGVSIIFPVSVQAIRGQSQPISLVDQFQEGCPEGQKKPNQGSIFKVFGLKDEKEIDDERFPLGTATVIDKRGYLVTASHIFEKGFPSISFSQPYKGKLLLKSRNIRLLGSEVGMHRKNKKHPDISIIKIEESSNTGNLSFLPVALLLDYVASKSGPYYILSYPQGSYSLNERGLGILQEYESATKMMVMKGKGLSGESGAMLFHSSGQAIGLLQGKDEDGNYVMSMNKEYSTKNRKFPYKANQGRLFFTPVHKGEQIFIENLPKSSRYEKLLMYITGNSLGDDPDSREKLKAFEYSSIDLVRLVRHLESLPLEDLNSYKSELKEVLPLIHQNLRCSNLNIISYVISRGPLGKFFPEGFFKRNAFMAFKTYNDLKGSDPNNTEIQELVLASAVYSFKRFESSIQNTLEGLKKPQFGENEKNSAKMWLSPVKNIVDSINIRYSKFLSQYTHALLEVEKSFPGLAEQNGWNSESLRALVTEKLRQAMELNPLNNETYAIASDLYWDAGLYELANKSNATEALLNSQLSDQQTLPSGEQNNPKPEAYSIYSPNVYHWTLGEDKDPSSYFLPEKTDENQGFVKVWEGRTTEHWVTPLQANDLSILVGSGRYSFIDKT